MKKDSRISFGISGYQLSAWSLPSVPSLRHLIGWRLKTKFCTALHSHCEVREALGGRVRHGTCCSSIMDHYSPSWRRWAITHLRPKDMNVSVLQLGRRKCQWNELVKKFDLRPLGNRGKDGDGTLGFSPHNQWDYWEKKTQHRYIHMHIQQPSEASDMLNSNIWYWVDTGANTRQEKTETVPSY